MTVTFTPRSADRIAKVTQWAEKQVGLERPASGTALPADTVYVLTTSGTATSGLYPGKVVLYDANADTWREYGTVKLRPANSETLANATRYAARYTGRTSGGDDVFTVLQGGGGLTAEEADGSPSYTGVTKLQFDQADGFVLSNPSTGTVKVDIAEATASQAGIVGTGSQTFGGKKAFNNQIVSHNASGSTTSGQVILAKTTGTSPTEYLSIWADFTSTYTSLRFTDDTFGNYATLQANSGSSDLLLTGPSGGNGSISAGNYNAGLSLEIADLSFGAGINVSSSTSYFWCKRSSTSYNGATGTIGSSAKVAGGIVYSLGTVAVQSSSWMGF
jgi:hypothetical protein